MFAVVYLNNFYLGALNAFYEVFFSQSRTKPKITMKTKFLPLISTFPFID